MDIHFAEARKWAKSWGNEKETELFIYWTKSGDWTRERAMVSTYWAVARYIRSHKIEIGPDENSANQNREGDPL
jgi:hypothetical protein